PRLAKARAVSKGGLEPRDQLRAIDLTALAVMGDTDLGRLRVRVARVAAQRDEAPGRARAHGVRAGLGASMDEGRQRFHERGVEGTSTPFRLWESPAFRWPK